MLETIRQDLTALDAPGRLEFFQKYYSRREADMAKPSTYNPGVKKKAKAKTAKVKAAPKGKQVTSTKLKMLDADTLALLRKAGVEV